MKIGRIEVCAGMAALVVLAGCAGSATTAGSSISSSTGLSTYVGTQPSVGNFRGVYGMTLDDSTQYFSFTDQNFGGLVVGGANFVGNFQNTDGFLKLSVTEENASLSSGNLKTQPYAIEIAGGGALVDMNAQIAPVVFAESNGCPASGSGSYQFIQLGGAAGRDATQQGYGRVKVSMASSGWSFSNYDLLSIDGTDQKPAALGDGVCAKAPEGYVTSIPVTLNQTAVVYTAAVSDSGFFIMDRDPSGTQTPLVGMSQPTSAVDPKALTAASYVGFEFDYFTTSPQGSSSYMTQPVGFQAGAASGQLVGGVFPSSDVTQSAATNMTLSLGEQDANNNGFFPSVVATFPDVTQSCVGRPNGGTDASGNPTCIFPGVAIANNPGGKYALFVTLANTSDRFGTSTIQFLLYQK